LQARRRATRSSKTEGEIQEIVGELQNKAGKVQQDIAKKLKR
jgi:uncharacterized protein YjbJ (UPF0337 family)